MKQKLWRFLHKKEIEEEAIFYPEGWKKDHNWKPTLDYSEVWVDAIDKCLENHSLTSNDLSMKLKLRRAYVLGYKDRASDYLEDEVRKLIRAVKAS